MAGRRRTRRRLRLLLALSITLTLLFTLLPYDSSLRLAVTFNIDRLAATIRNRRDDWWWVDSSPPYPVDIAKDVVVIMHTGWGTRARAKAWLEAVESEGDDLLPTFEHVSVVADFDTLEGQHLTYRDRPMPIVDMVARTVASLPSELQKGERLSKAAKLKAAAEATDPDLDAADGYSKEFGWELDAMKFISALEAAFLAQPTRKWFLLIDDDTYLVRSSLAAILGQLDPARPHFLGNAVGDFRMRFGHGGSGLVFSRAALDRLFRSAASEGVVGRAKVESLSETWGDRLIARAMLRVGIRIEERRGLFFNGEPPRLTRIRPERFCAPIASFHHLRAEEFGETSRIVERRSGHAVRWVEIWDMFGAVEFEAFEREPIRKGWDHVGSLEFDDRGDAGVDKGVGNVEGCKMACERKKKGKGCLAWTWDGKKEECKLAGWMVAGVGEGNEGMSTGINIKWAKELAERCI